MTPSQLFQAVPLPAGQYITFNQATPIDGAIIPARDDWNDPVPVTSPIDLCQKDWIEADWTAKTVLCVVPAAIPTERRIADGDSRCHWLGLDFDSQTAPTLTSIKQDLAAFSGFYYTTKSHGREKNGVTCDRYRCFLAYSRPVSNEENHIIHNLLAVDLGHDPACGDVYRLFYPSRPGSIYGKFGGDKSVDVAHLLGIAATRGITASRAKATQHKAMRQTIITNAGSIDWNKGKVAPKLKRSLSWIWTNRYAEACSKQTLNTRDAIWAIMHRSIEQTDSLADIGATLEACPWFMDWYKRKGEDYRAKLVEVYADAITETAGRIATYDPLTPATPIDYGRLPPIPKQYEALLAEFRKCYDYTGTPEQDRTHQALLHAVGQGQSILGIACGMEKSVGAAVYTAAHYKTHPVWIVCENHKAVKDTRKRLKALNIPDSAMGYITGWQEGACTQSAGHKARDFYNKKTTPCRNCPTAAACDFSKTLYHFKLEIRRPIVLMTHCMFTIRMQPWGLQAQEYGVRADTVVLIDEQLRRWETGAYTRAQIESALGLAGEDTRAILNAIDDACDATGKISDAKTINTGVGIIADNEGVHNRQHAIRTIQSHDLEDEDHQRAVEIVTLLCTRSKRFVIRQRDTYSILADRRNWDMPPRCVMLDASARFTQVKWEGFQMLDGGMADVAGLTVHITRGNPTKSSIADPIRGKKYQDFWQGIIDSVKPSVVVYALNQNDRTFTAPNPKDLIARRGTDTRGSNDYLNADAMVVIMALFNDLPDYCLRAALATDGPIEASAIWKNTPRGIVPNMDKSGFVDHRLHISFCRQAVDELYQSVMRIGVRRYDGGTYHVACRLPDRLSIAELQGRLPGATFDVRGFKVGEMGGNHAQADRVKFDNASLAAIRAIYQKYHVAA